MKRKIPWRKILVGEFTWKRLVRSVIFIYGSLVAFAYFFSERIIFPYSDSSYSRGVDGLRILAATDGTQLAARYWAAPEAELLVLHFHGNAEDIGDFDEIAEELVARGYSVLTLDYRGYGMSEGTPTEANCYADGESIYAEAQKLGFSGDRIIFWGRSVGSGIATELAVRKKVRALVLESPFMSAFRASTGIAVFPFDKFKNISKIGKIDEPLFILHGDSDEEIAAWHSEKLFDKHQGPKERHVIKGAGHQDVWAHDLEAELDALDIFVGNTGAGSPPSGRSADGIPPLHQEPINQ